MPISFACACGKRFKVPDELSGKRAKCPACGVTNTIPPTEEEVVEFEEVEDEPVEADEEPAEAEAITDEPKKKKKKKEKGRKYTSMADMYMAEARKKMKRDAERGPGRSGKADGWTIGGVHITAGVISGICFNILGVLLLIVAVVLHDYVGPITFIRLLYGGFGCVATGLVILARALFYGSED